MGHSSFAGVVNWDLLLVFGFLNSALQSTRDESVLKKAVKCVIVRFRVLKILAIGAASKPHTNTRLVSFQQFKKKQKGVWILSWLVTMEKPKCCVVTCQVLCITFFCAIKLYGLLLPAAKLKL